MLDTTNINALSSVVYTLDSFIGHVQKALPGVSCVYDENLGYDTGLRELRDANNMRDGLSHKFPAFFFKRSILRPADAGISRRSIGQRVKSQEYPTSLEANVFKVLSGAITIEFLFCSPNLAEMENFEVSYMVEDSFNQIKDMDVGVPTFKDKFVYHMKFEPLVEKTINGAENSYKALAGTLDITGTYVVFNSKSALIKEIVFKIQEYNSNVILSQRTII